MNSPYTPQGKQKFVIRKSTKSGNWCLCRWGLEYCRPLFVTPYMVSKWIPVYASKNLQSVFEFSGSQGLLPVKIDSLLPADVEVSL